MANPRERMRRPLPVAELLPSVTTGSAIEKRLREAKIWLEWNAAVGDVVAAKARPVSFRDGVLTVAVVSAPWMQQLAFLKPQLISNLNNRLGFELVRDVYLRASEQEKPSPVVSAPTPPRRTLSPSEREQIVRQAGAAGDSELAAALASLHARHKEESGEDTDS